MKVVSLSTAVKNKARLEIKKKKFGRKFATSYENLVATKMLVAKLIEAI